MTASLPGNGLGTRRPQAGVRDHGAVPDRPGRLLAGLGDAMSRSRRTRAYGRLQRGAGRIFCALSLRCLPPESYRLRVTNELVTLCNHG